MVSTGSGTSSSCFVYNSNTNKCQTTCVNGQSCPSHSSCGGCPTYNVFMPVQFTTYAGACPNYPKGDAWTLTEPVTDDDNGVKTTGTFTFTYCFVGNQPVYLHQQWQVSDVNDIKDPFARTLMESVETADDDRHPPRDVFYAVQSYNPTAPPASDFAMPSYCTC
jgi:hypothetical protein